MYCMESAKWCGFTRVWGHGPGLCMTDLTASRPNLDRISDRGLFGRSDDVFVLHESRTLDFSGR